MRAAIACMILLSFSSQKLPTNTILIKGAEPSASDNKTALPEDGRYEKGRYVNPYFGLAYPIPPSWGEAFQGPPPSDSGQYVLAQLKRREGDGSKATISITAQDEFFSLVPARTALETVQFARDHLPADYKIERPPAELEIAGRPFVRFDYVSPVAGLHWTTLATESRCHVVKFVFISRDTKLIDEFVSGMRETKFADDGPLCVPDYAPAAVYKVDPVITDRRFNSIPARIVIGKDGRVEHVHVISAFPDQAAVIKDAVLQWRFRPYLQNGQPVRVETGVLFGAKR